MAQNFRRKGGCCSAFGCSMTKGTNLLSEIRMFKFPREPVRRAQWASALKRKNWIPTNNSLLCSRHFVAGKPSSEVGHPDYVPSIFDFGGSSLLNGKKQIERFERSAKRKKLADNAIQDNSKGQTSVTVDVVQDEITLGLVSVSTDVATQTDISADTLDSIYNENLTLKHRVQILEEENKCIRESMAFLPIFNSITKASNKVFKFFTGLENFLVFQCLLQYLLSAWKPKTKVSLNSSEQFLLVLMKLRLGLLNQDLAMRFNISPASVSKIFHSWLDVMMVNFRRFITYPSQKTIKKSMPTCFHEMSLSDVTCVIDCSEIFIEKPKNLTARAQTFSNYKSHNTMKFLVGILPAGNICFISRAWGGRVSDKQITLHSGFLDILRANDVVLADRGFTISSMVEARGAYLGVPAFSKGKSQLSYQEIVQSRKMSKVRVHIERAIRKIKTFKILDGNIPISMVKRNNDLDFSTVDKILCVVSAIINAGNPLIKQ